MRPTHPTLPIALLLLAPLTVRADSLWLSAANPERSMFADRKASRTGDILTVVISESAATQSSQSKKTSKESSADASVSSFLFPAAASGFGKHNGGLPVTAFTGKSDASGSGQINNTQSLNARAAVLVTGTLPNGNLVIEGVRVITFSGETQYVVLHGLVRPDDISSGNTVLSSSIADVRIEFISEGALTDAQKKGWLTKLYETLRPY